MGDVGGGGSAGALDRTRPTAAHSQLVIVTSMHGVACVSSYGKQGMADKVAVATGSYIRADTLITGWKSRKQPEVYQTERRLTDARTRTAAISAQDPLLSMAAQNLIGLRAVQGRALHV